MPIIRTTDDWWAAVDSNWEYLLDIIAHHIDLSHPAYDIPGNASSPMLLRSDTSHVPRTVMEELIKLKEARNQKLCRYFAAAWGLASDAYAYSVPGWGVLCDLCSEEWVFQEETIAS